MTSVAPVLLNLDYTFLHLLQDCTNYYSQCFIAAVPSLISRHSTAYKSCPVNRLLTLHGPLLQCLTGCTGFCLKGSPQSKSAHGGLYSQKNNAKIVAVIGDKGKFHAAAPGTVWNIQLTIGDIAFEVELIKYTLFLIKTYSVLRA